MERVDKVAILVGPKGRGSNMGALIRATREGLVPAEIGVVIGPAVTSPALSVAEALGTTIAIVQPDEEYGKNLLSALKGCQWICLAGFLRILPEEVLRAFPKRVLNIHPSLLPKFGGKGMYGRRVHEAVLAAGEHESGCSVHYVTEVYDEGEVVLQSTCPVLAGDTAETLAARVLEREHQTYPAALAKVINARRS